MPVIGVRDLVMRPDDWVGRVSRRAQAGQVKGQTLETTGYTGRGSSATAVTVGTL